MVCDDSNLENENEVLVYITGGTIDAEAYNDPKNPPAEAKMLDKTIVPTLLENQNITNYKVEIGQRLDSKLFKYEDLEKIADDIKESGLHNVVITHGTDMMIDNAKILLSILQKKNINVNVTFTGAFVPYDNEIQVSEKAKKQTPIESDAKENITLAMSETGKEEPSKPSVKICLNGQIYSDLDEIMKWPNPEKNEPNQPPYIIINKKEKSQELGKKIQKAESERFSEGTKRNENCKGVKIYSEVKGVEISPARQFNNIMPDFKY
jgi:L-asparaginase/Glu-tRNA(Gln) amidotransferase subunit D